MQERFLSSVDSSPSKDQDVQERCPSTLNPEKKRRKTRRGKSKQKGKGKAVRIIPSRLAHTKGDIEKLHTIYKWYDVFSTRKYLEANGAPIVAFWKSLVPKVIIQKLQQSTERLAKEAATIFKRDKSRISNGLVTHLGCWRRSALEPRIIPNTFRAPVKRWIEANKDLWKVLDSLFHEVFPTLYKEYMAVKMVERFFGPWSTCAININCKTKPHTDQNDYRNGLCWVIPFGEFTGGELVIGPNKLRIHALPGDITAFRSYHLQHWNQPYEGYIGNDMQSNL